MSLDSHSLERLRELGRKLPQSLPKDNSKSKPQQTKSKESHLHPIETEQNPQKLFKELMNASPDGNIPSHLIDRLKEIELLEVEENVHKNNNIKSHSKAISPYENNMKPKKQKENLYISFKQLLLEEEEESTS